MIRIVLIVIRVLWILPYWVFQMRRYQQIEKYSSKERYGFVREIAFRVNRTGRVKVQSYGLENLPEKSGYLLAPNHQGLEDPVAIVATHDRPIRAIVKQELTKVPLIKSVVKISEFIPMKREDVRGSVKIIKEAAKAMKEGQNFFVFPEGTRSRDKNNILEFKGGTFKMATIAKVPIVPVAIMDSYKVFDINSLKKVTVKIHYLKPLYYEEYKDMHTNEIARVVHDRVEACIKEHQ